MKKKTAKKVVKKPLRLPSRLSDLITVALNDLEMIEKSKKYTVKMDSNFHLFDAVTKKCEVCFAGAFLAKSCGVTPNYSGSNYVSNMFIDHYESSFTRKIRALDLARYGNISGAFCVLKNQKIDSHNIQKLKDSGLFDEANVTDYQYDKGYFKSEMRGIAARLKHIGL